MRETAKRAPWAWIPTLYFSQGLPYVIVMTVSVIMYKSFGISNTKIAFYTSWLYLPWVIKPLWSPFVDIFFTKRKWVLATQFILGISLASVALTLPTPHYFQYSMAFLWLMAFNSATHDIASDGLYLISLTSKEQSFFVGIRSTFYRIAMITGQGLVVILAGYLEETLSNPYQAWSIVFAILAGLYISFFIYHKFALPEPEIANQQKKKSLKEVFAEFIETFKLFFQQKNIVVAILFLMTYRLGESQLVKLASPFLLDSINLGGLGLSTSQVGLIYGTFGIIALVIGGVIGGVLASGKGLNYWIWWMLLAINLPNGVYVFLSYAQPDSFWVITSAIVIEQLGYGFGFTGYMLFMIYISRGKYQTAHFAITTGFMALGMMIPGMISGWIQELVGYQHFFIWVLVATIPSFIVTAYLKIDKDFGVK